MADDIICRCTDCVYYHSANGQEKTSGNMMCHFALENGYPRLIPPVDCYKKDGTGYISRKDKDKDAKMQAMKKGELDMARRLVTVDIKQAAVEDVNKGGLTIQQVADKFGVGRSSLTRWLKEEREKTGVFGEDWVVAEVPVESEDDLTEVKVIFPASELVEKIPVPEETEKKFDYSILKPRPEPVFRPVEEKQDAEVTEDVEPVKRCESNERIKAAAFDEIADITDRYAGAGDKEMLFYINGVIGLTERLCGGNENG